MAQEPPLDALVAPLRADVVSGAAVIARTAADVVRRAAVRLPAGTVEELRWGLGQVAVRVLDAQPAMAPLVGLVGAVLDAAEEADSVEEARHEVARAADAFRSTLDARGTEAARQAAAVLPRGAAVATVSSSSTIREALLLDPTAVGTVYCLESRPLREGRSLAEALARAGIAVTYAVDGAVAALVRACDVVLLGADSIGDAGVVNKIGSWGLALTARELGVPVHVVADETKVLPTGFPQHLTDDRPGAEVWHAPAGVSVWNRYFESIPLEWAALVVTDAGPMSPDQVESKRATMRIPESLAGWARARRSGPGGGVEDPPPGNAAESMG